MATSEIDPQRLRAAKNQSLFRDVNEWIEHIAEQFALSTEKLDFVCSVRTTSARSGSR
jgi:hypothetical protein